MRSARTAASTARKLLNATRDAFGGRIVLVDAITQEYSNDAAVDFAADLQHSLASWREDKAKGVWLHIPATHSALLAPALDEGFLLHHTEPDRIVVSRNGTQYC